MKKRSILVSIMTIALCFCLITGSTFALFTSEKDVNIAVTAGTVNVEATLVESSIRTWSLGETEADARTDGTYANKGSLAAIEDGELKLTNILPGDTTQVTIDIENKSNVSILYRICMSVDGELGEVLVAEATVNGEALEFKKGATAWTYVEEPETAIDDIVVTVVFPDGENINDYQGKECTVILTVEAIQGNADVTEAWDGTADTTWYNDTDTEFSLSKPAQIAGLADLVDGGNTFEGKTIKLDADMDFEAYDESGERISFDPIGYGYDVVFKGTFDGQGHTISNLYQNGWALGLSYGTQGGGMFASVVDATFKDLNIDGFEVIMECVDMGALVGYSYGNCTYENITVSNGTIANYQRYTGGVVGEVNGTQTFINVDVASDVVVSSLWGDFDCSIGGIVGGKYGECELTFVDCDVACELNVYNDVTSSYQWYAYRRAGMLIGNSEETMKDGDRTVATASYLTATNCTVTYGDWVNYTYCEFGGTSWPYVRVQGGYSSDPYSNPRYGVATDANGNKAVDDTHVHNEGEDHNVLLVFDQLFGGGQGVYGTATHEGVTVIYPDTDAE